MIAANEKQDGGERLTRNQKRILERWRKIAASEVLPAEGASNLALEDELPQFLEQLATALEKKEKSSAQLKQEFTSRAKVSKSHGKVRASTSGYLLQDVMFEFRILREVIFEVLEEEKPLLGIDRDIILYAIEIAKENAAIEFSDALRDIKERFIITLTHDLRTPLTAAKAASELSLARPNDPVVVAKAAVQIRNCMDRMDSMIQDILTASRLRAGETLPLEFADFDLRARVRDIVDEYSITNPGRIRITTTGEIWGHWSADGLGRVIENLITNALKYGNSNSPISISLEKSKENVTLTVHNEGNPIPPDQHELLFEQFRRAKTPGHKAGWGIGLMLARGIVDAHCGTIHVESSADKGTDFIVSLPIRAARAVKRASWDA